MSLRLAELIGNAHAFESLDEFRHGIPSLRRSTASAAVGVRLP